MAGSPAARSTSDAFLCSLFSDSPRSFRPQPMESRREAAPCEVTREERGLSFFVKFPCTAYCCRCFFKELVGSIPRKAQAAAGSRSLHLHCVSCPTLRAHYGSPRLLPGAHTA